MSQVYDRYYDIDGVQVQGWDILGTDAHERMNKRDRLVWMYGHNYEHYDTYKFNKCMAFVFSMNDVELTHQEQQWYNEYRQWMDSARVAREEARKEKANKRQSKGGF